MLMMEEANGMLSKRDECVHPSKQKEEISQDHSNWKFDDVDDEFIERGISLITRQGGLTDDTDVLCNVYTPT